MNNTHKYKISYILTTYNKFPYLSITIPFFISKINFHTDELIVVDGASTDGTKAYLEKLYQEKKITKFISEKDIGEAHGFNKAILMAEGQYIKILTDDDAYNFDIIHKSVDFLDSHPDVDWMGSEGLIPIIQGEKISFRQKNDFFYFRRYRDHHIPFILTGLSYLIRRESITKLGLFNTNLKIVDVEYSLRNLSNPKIIFAFSKIPFYINIVNELSNSIRYEALLTKEIYQLQKMYHGESTLKLNIWWLKRKKYLLLNRYLYKNTKHEHSLPFQVVFEKSVEHLYSYNSSNHHPKIFYK
ncbi:MAG: glycosyltransferase [Bacteroidia bacterium]